MNTTFTNIELDIRKARELIKKYDPKGRDLMLSEALHDAWNTMIDIVVYAHNKYGGEGNEPKETDMA